MSNQDNVKKVEFDGQARLLSQQERQAFKLISAGDDLNGQRALALLAIDEGATQKEAGMRSGLTPGQVKYLLTRFRQLRLEIFPDRVLENVGLIPGSLKPEPEDEKKMVAEKSPKPAKKAKTKGKKQAKKSAKVKKGQAGSGKSKKPKKKKGKKSQKSKSKKLR